MLWSTLGLVLILATLPGQFSQPPVAALTFVNFSQPPVAALTFVQFPAKRKPHDRGNCFKPINCRGDSIGATWIAEPDLCKAIGGRSWMNYDQKCYNLRAGPQGLI